MIAIALFLYKFVKNFSLKKYFAEYTPFLLFLAKFFGTYLILIFLYQSYLSSFNSANQVDGFTKVVANHSRMILSFFDNQSFTKANPAEASVKMYYHNAWVARIIEGCNSLSVVALFISFIIAFTGKFKTTIVYIFMGSLIIYIFNILRIAFLCMAIYNYPSYEHVLHDIIFPLVIYGVVFTLWLLWINKFSFYATHNKK